jgi:hypothetical protein
MCLDGEDGEMGEIRVHQDWFEVTTVNQRTIHWMPVITQLWMNLK